jgi:hypothetical protein
MIELTALLPPPWPQVADTFTGRYKWNVVRLLVDIRRNKNQPWLRRGIAVVRKRSAVLQQSRHVIAAVRGVSKEHIVLARW